jgi:uncharacterized RDD family membrane protein YckC
MATSALDPEAVVSWSSRRRGVAWTVDALIVGGVAAGGVAAMGDDVEWLMSAPGVGLVLALGWVYLGLLTSRSGQSLGKRVAGLGVARSDGRPPGRLRLLGRAACDMATVGLFIVASDVFELDRYGDQTWTAVLVGALVLPAFLLAWWLRDNALDLTLVRAPRRTPSKP